MHTVELLDAALATARSLGYQVRFEWLGGSCGGSCELKGQKCIFVDMALTSAEQLAHVAEALGLDRMRLPLPPAVEPTPILPSRKCA